MTVNKRELAEIIHVSQRTLTTWQQQGMPIANVGGRGLSNQYDAAAVLAWRHARKAARVRCVAADQVQPAMTQLTIEFEAISGARDER